jgi:hypothetical protein
LESPLHCCVLVDDCWRKLITDTSGLLLCVFGGSCGVLASPMSFRCLCGAQALHASLHPEGDVPIAWFLLLYGIIQLALSQIPTMHHLRHLNAAAVAMTMVWTIMSAYQCIRTGARQPIYHLLERLFGRAA